MSIDLTGITNKNEYYTNHYFATVFEENASSTISGWNAASKEAEEFRTPWSLLRQNARQYYAAHDRFVRSSMNLHTLSSIRTLADSYLASLGYPEAKPEVITVNDTLTVPIYLEMTKSNGAPLLWVILSASKETDTGIMESYAFNSADVEEDANGTLYKGILNEIPNEDLATKILFGSAEPPRFLVFISMNQIALIDRNKWNEKRYLQFELEEIFSRLENTTLQAMAVLLHKDSLCPREGKILLDELDEQSQKNAFGVSQNLKYALRESIELLGNEVLYDMAHRLGRDLEADPVDAGKLTLECLRYMYRMLFVLFIESRPELGYAPIKAQTYYSGYSLESLRDIADNIRDDVAEVGNGYYLHDTLAKLYELIYDGYPKTEEELRRAADSDSLHDMFLIAPLKAHIFDPGYTKMITAARLRNYCMLRIIDLMSLTKSTGKKNDRRGRISYANLGINQMGAVYEALLSYRGFIAEHDLYEVKRAGDSFNELDVGYFVSEAELDQYTEDERVRYETGEKKGKLRMYEKGTFIYRLAGREREKSASYYTPEVLTKCLVKYALKELLEGKTADEILNLTICEPAMGSAAFLNEAINQLAEAYISRKEKENGDIISYEKRFNELQKVKMYIADRNVYGIDLNPVAVELAEVSLWLNTIYEGGFVPWFGTQLVNGNSLIGARRQVYSEAFLQATSKGMRWYENEPERVLLGTERKKKKGYAQIYHFLLGDPGMCSYSDKVIKSLELDNIKKMGKWSKKFTEPLSDDDLVTLRRLSDVIDELWSKQIELQREIEAKTQDNLSIYGHEDTSVDSHATIREKDKIFSELYKSEHMKNAGPYARLKFAMDYWCALWFWPIEQADLLPSRSEFLFDMSLILEGTTRSVLVTDASTDKKQTRGQLTLFPTEMQQLEMNILALYDGIGEVDIPALGRENPRLNLAYEIAEQNKFMHWELEFAKLFAERGGFDLVIGNPPWIKMEWNEQAVLSDTHPMFAVKKLTATQTISHREEALGSLTTRALYFMEYESLSGTQSFLNAIENYADLKGQQTNLFKCFLPQAWQFTSTSGVSAFVHPDGVYDDPKGGLLREKLYPRLRKHFQFTNELKLFSEVDHHTVFSLNVYCNKGNSSFDSIGNLFSVSTIEECYDRAIKGAIPGIKDENNNWNIHGHPSRIVYVEKKELQLFAKLFDGSEEWKQARLPVLHAQALVDVLECFAVQEKTLGDIKSEICTTEMWHETNRQKDGTISRDVHFPETTIDLIYSGPHIGISNPLSKTSRAICVQNSDYEVIDLTMISDNYLQRCNYRPACDMGEYSKRAPETPWRTKNYEGYRIIMRNMFNQSGERTLISAIAPCMTGHVHAVFEIGFSDNEVVVSEQGLMASIPLDFYIKATGKGSGGIGVISGFPYIEPKKNRPIIVRTAMLNCLTANYSELWKSIWKDEFQHDSWSKNDLRLRSDKFTALSLKWTWDTPLRTDYERRQALIEIDVLSARALGITLEQLKTIYRIQFPVLQSYEADTWYDANGRIVFTNNRSLVGIGFDRTTWENEVKDAPAGKKFYRTITDDTMPGGPVERTIEYVAPFDRCDREQDYETAWKFFEKKYGNTK
ncbi:Eco57I restriction-modification methylase domain-containing protein [Hungatella sp. SB206]|uniref:Eco57I restriction-modification methylase domain-containing protein n=1 Tax=Hungatella sp. SB206 TaxID=2937758 RepID=UPI003DA8BEB8